MLSLRMMGDTGVFFRPPPKGVVKRGEVEEMGGVHVRGGDAGQLPDFDAALQAANDAGAAAQ